MKDTNEGTASNRLSPEIESAIEAEAKATADAVRARRRVDALLAQSFETPTPVRRATDLTTGQLADALGCSTATIARSGIEPTRYVGASPRWDLDDARAKLKTRGRKPTTPTKRVRTERDVDVDDALGRAGLRLAVSR